MCRKSSRAARQFNVMLQKQNHTTCAVDLEPSPSDVDDTPADDRLRQCKLAAQLPNAASQRRKGGRRAISETTLRIKSRRRAGHLKRGWRISDRGSSRNAFSTQPNPASSSETRSDIREPISRLALPFILVAGPRPSFGRRA